MLEQIKFIVRDFIANKNYKKIFKKIKENSKNRKINVLFLVRENSKWTYESLYHEMEKSRLFSPIIAVSLLRDVARGKDKTRNDLDSSYKFFKNKNYNVVKAYENKKFLNLKTFNPDIIFYDQPWDLPQKHNPFTVSSFALTAYCDYGLELFYNNDSYRSNFHALLYKFFVDNKSNSKRYNANNLNRHDNCISFGYPKLDTYLIESSIAEENIWKEPNKFKIIYAPHHSFEENGLNLATFRHNGYYILNLAKKHHLNTTWIFKPHPRLKYALIKNDIMTEKEINDYFDEWNKLGKIYDKGEYFDIFKTSDLMITDCCSFLGEYLPTKKPIIQLVNPKHKEFNVLGKKITSQNYKAHNNLELNKYFEAIVINKNDSLCENRIKLIPELIDKKTSASKIIEYLTNEIEGNNNA